ncbi:FHA domain-containing protein [Streptomyces mirabilis]|uniref:FHA domain-containing protein n=1 Tax=Streptomyces mirabilis TaxID=68239 RepID=UPI0033208E88
MEIRGFIPQVLPASMLSLASGVPSAPPGTIFVKAAQGGYAVPPRKFTLHFGRATNDVHVAVGADDFYVSRLHGVFTCDGNQWWLRNEGKRPIQMPGADMVLRGHELPMTAGYTPLTIETPNCKSHLLEVHIVGYPGNVQEGDSQMSTATSDVYYLGHAERLVLTALAQRYLRQDRYPQPVSWKQVADDLNRVATYRSWTPRIAEHTIAALRKRLAAGRDPISGILREDGIGEPVGNTLNDNLIRALLKNATLIPQDLYLLGEEI